jgi:hypothetical protein
MSTQIVAETCPATEYNVLSKDIEQFVEVVLGCGLLERVKGGT